MGPHPLDTYKLEAFWPTAFLRATSTRAKWKSAKWKSTKVWNLIPYHGIRRGKNHLGWKPWLLFHLHHENPKGPLVNWHVASRWHIPIFNRKCIDSIRVFDPGYRKSHRYQLIQAKVYSMATCSFQTLVKEVMFFFLQSSSWSFDNQTYTRNTPGSN